MKFDLLLAAAIFLRVSHAEQRVASDSPSLFDPTSPNFVGNNLTIGFYPTGSNVTCNNGSKPSGALTFTTYSYNTNYVCFNVDDLITRNSSGWEVQTSNIRLKPYQKGVNYTIFNQNVYRNTNTSFTGIYIESVNNTVVAGRDAGRQVLLYNIPNCVDAVPGQGLTPANIQEQTCQTQAGGECHATPERVQSFRLGPSFNQVVRDGKCKAYEPYYQAAASMSVKTSTLAIAGSAIFAVFWTVL
ncbi:uncharacterized protein K489DRAFT_246738 [Dissoconium aciculare CBS 342.82]|uniref:Uncharacterized protein n=1 Tax=Dissoconium aciculare CBS 342.82 TaxID=1314786 RepID=A0A6J3M346_9PEZI|nr:uncharacterized protein K489DRAFT_246738 [Dissoconium aciculare CBS 342.82]KAF1821357.1 hypothetical protein K489DRAFT_246738 [Dissoconium aciculare CBS 342.82]